MTFSEQKAIGTPLYPHYDESSAFISQDLDFGNLKPLNRFSNNIENIQETLNEESFLDPEQIIYMFTETK
jgi:hypothetical protein